VEVSNVDGKLQLSNTEGSIRVDRITKPVVIDSRGSRIEAQNLQDSLKLTASHKDIEIADVASTVIVDIRYA
jgi:phage-related protein